MCYLNVNIENGNRQSDLYMIPDIIWQLLQMCSGQGEGEIRDICFLDYWKRGTVHRTRKVKKKKSWFSREAVWFNFE